MSGILLRSLVRSKLIFPRIPFHRQNTYTVNADGSLTIHVSQMPPNPALFAPGPAILHVVVDGVPSVGQAIIVGGGFIGQQNIQNAAALPPNKG